MASGNINKISDFKESKDSQDLISDHNNVRQYYDERNTKREICHDFVKGKHFTGPELESFRNKRKTPVIFNSVKTNERTIIGTFLQNKYDVKFSPTEENDQDESDRLEKLRIWESQRQGDKRLDIELIREAWAGGTSYQECYMDVLQGKKPMMHTSWLNPFATYWDPDSRELITRGDARFVDLKYALDLDEIINAFPEKKSMIEEGIVQTNTQGFESTDVHKDRSHESRNEKNGKYFLIERYYKVMEPSYYAFNEEGTQIDIPKKEVELFKEDFPHLEINKEFQETLYVAIACESVSFREYLYNGEYHCQPRDLGTKKIIWPILEMVAESLSGDPSGFVEHEIDPAKAFDSMISNILHSAKHSASQGKLIDPNAFQDEKAFKDASRNHSDADKAFPVKPGRVNDAMAPIQQSSVSNDVYQGLSVAKEFMIEIGSTPPALQGVSENSSTSGILNAQRIEQAYIQLQVLVSNYRAFLEQRNKLRYAYWREYYTEEMVFRVTNDDTGAHEFYKINEMVPETDEMGANTGGVKKLHDISVGEYDVTVEDSFRSPTFRYKTQQQIAEMMQTQAVQSDPVLLQFLVLEWIRLSDASNDLKAGVKEHASIMKQWELQKKQIEQQQMQMGAVQQGQEVEKNNQQIAQTEAEQTVPALPPMDYEQDPSAVDEEFSKYLQGL